MVPAWKWGITWSSNMTNTPPKRKLTAAGTQENLPKRGSAPLSEGMRSDHTEAAIMTPAAKPRRIELVRFEMSPRKQYTNAEPAVVARKMIANPMRVMWFICCSFEWGEDAPCYP